MPPRRRNIGRNEGENEIPRGERQNLPPPRAIEELFLRQNPPSFNGTGSPVDAELWVRSMKQVPAQTQQSGDRGKRKWEGNPREDNQGNYGNQGGNKPWQGNQAPQGQGQVQWRQDNPGQSGNPSRVNTCPKCQRTHLGPCLVGSGKCYKCGQQGHHVKQCPGWKQGEGNRNPGQPSQAQPLRAVQGYPQVQQARAYALQQDQPERNQGNLKGYMLFNYSM